MAYRETYEGKVNRKLNKKLRIVEVAAGRQKAGETEISGIPLTFRFRYRSRLKRKLPSCWRSIRSSP